MKRPEMESHLGIAVDGADGPDAATGAAPSAPPIIGGGTNNAPMTVGQMNSPAFLLGRMGIAAGVFVQCNAHKELTVWEVASVTDEWVTLQDPNAEVKGDAAKADVKVDADAERTKPTVIVTKRPFTPL